MLASATLLGMWAGPAAAETEGKIRIGLPVPHYTPCAVVTAADELGFYKKNGISAEITSYSGGNSTQEALLENTSDMVIYFPGSAALAVKKGVKEKIVGCGEIWATGWHVMVGNDLPITSIKELDGKKVGLGGLGGAVYAYMLWVAQHEAIKIQPIAVGPGGLVPSLKGNQVAACLLHSGLALPMLASHQARSIFDLGTMEPSCPDTWVSLDSFIEQKPKILAAGLRSIYQATAYMQKNREWSIAHLKKFTGQTDDTLVNLEYDVLIKALPTSGHIERKWLEFALELSRQAGMTELASVEQLYTEKFAKISAS